MASAQGQVLPDTGSRLVLRSRLGAITLVLLCAMQFLDIADSAIVNVALPSIQHNLRFSQQNLQWVASGYILTYGGFLLLGGRPGGLLGRRRMLLTGLTVFALSSLAAGLAGNPALLVAAGALLLLATDRGARTGAAAFDSQGAVLVTGGMLLLVYSLVRAPIVGWGSIQTILTLTGSAILMAAFALNEVRSRNPLVP